MSEGNMRRNPERAGQLVIGAILLVVGGLLLAGQFVEIRLAQFGWPFFVILPGLAFFVGMALGGREAGGLAIPGSIITTVGLILLYQNTTNHWESWAYVWALIPTAVGVGTIIMGLWTGSPEQRRDGARLTGLGAVMFLIGLAFFETFIFQRGGDLLAYAGPAALIVLGLIILVGRGLRPGASSSPLSTAELDRAPDVTEREDV